MSKSTLTNEAVRLVVNKQREARRVKSITRIVSAPKPSEKKETAK